MIPARQSTALEIAIGPILDADGVAVTGGVVADLKIKKTSGNFAALNGSATLTHVSAGVYDLVLTTSDTDTVGLCTIAIDDTTNVCASIYLQVMEEAVYDMLYAASATGYVANQPVDVNTIKTQTVTCGAGVTVLASVGTAATSTAQTGDTYALANGSTGFVAIDTVVDSIKAKTDSLTFTVSNTLNAAVTHWVATAVATPTVNGVPEVDVTHWRGTAVATPTTAGVPEVDITFFNGVAFALAGLGQMDDHYANLGYITSQLTVAGVGEITTNVSAGVWLNGTRTLTAGTNINGSTFTSIPWNAAWDAEVQSEVQDAIEANNLDHLVKIAVDTNFATTVHADSVVGQIADNGAGFDRTTDSLEAIRDRGDAAWITATGFSTLSQADVRTAVGLASANLDTQLAAIVADTNELQTDWADGGRLDLIVDSILVDTAEIGAAGAGLTNINLPNQTMDITGNITGNLSGSVGSVTGGINTSGGVITTLDALDTAQDTQHGTTQAKTNNLPSDPADQSAVEAAILAAWTTALTESYSADGAAPTPAQALMLIMQRLTEFAISGTTITVKQLNGSTTAATLTLNDATSPTSSTRAS